MKTDDFLADLETQLREVQQPAARRPSPFARLWRPAAALAAVAAAVALVAVIGGGGTDEQAVPAGADHRLVLQNSTGYAPAGPEVARGLRQLGYDVTVRERPEIPDTSIFGADEDDQRRIADYLEIPVGDWTEYAPLEGAPPVMTVVLGVDFLGGGDGKGLDRVAVFEASGRPQLSLALEAVLHDAGLGVGGSGSFGLQGTRARTTVIGRDASDDELIAKTRAALGLPEAAPVHAGDRLGKAELQMLDGARVLVLIGMD
jgi:hypothetical protein